MDGERMSPQKSKQRIWLRTKNDPQQPRAPLRTTVVGSYPFPGWLEFAALHLDQFGEADIEEMRNDAVIVAVHDQVAAGLDVITDGEQTRYDFNLSFYGSWKAFAALRFLRAASGRRRTTSAENTRSQER